MSAGAVDVLAHLREMAQSAGERYGQGGAWLPEAQARLDQEAIAAVAALIAFKEAAEYMLAGRPDELRSIQRHAEGLIAQEARRHG